MDQQRKHDLCLYLVKRLMKERLDNGGYITQALLDIVPAKEEMDRASTRGPWSEKLFANLLYSCWSANTAGSPNLSSNSLYASIIFSSFSRITLP